MPLGGGGGEGRKREAGTVKVKCLSKATTQLFVRGHPLTLTKVQAQTRCRYYPTESYTQLLLVLPMQKFYWWRPPAESQLPLDPCWHSTCTPLTGIKKDDDQICYSVQDNRRNTFHGHKKRPSCWFSTTRIPRTPSLPWNIFWNTRFVQRNCFLYFIFFVLFACLFVRLFFNAMVFLSLIGLKTHATFASSKI